MGNYKKFCLCLVTILFSFVFIKDVDALNLDSYQFWAESKVITTNSFYTFDGGTGNNFNFALLGTVSDYITDGGDGADIYVKVSVCMDPVITSQYANEDKSQYDISNFQMYQTKTKCNFTGSSYTGGRIVDTYFKIWVSDSTDSFSSYWVVYPIMNFSIELISVEVNTTGFKIDYSSDTIIEQNETLIIQGATSIEYQKDSYKQQVETNEKLDSVNSSINETNDTLKDNNSDEATNEAGSFFSGFETDTFGLTSIVTAPLNLIESITSSTCVPMGLPIPFIEGQTLNLPCLRGIYEDNFGTFYDIYKTITFGIVAYYICVKLFNLVKDFKNPEHDEIEVLEL